MFRRAGVPDRASVKRRIHALVRSSRGRSRDELHRDLVLAKCLQTGAVGAVRVMMLARAIASTSAAAEVGWSSHLTSERMYAPLSRDV